MKQIRVKITFEIVLPKKYADKIQTESYGQSSPKDVIQRYQLENSFTEFTISKEEELSWQE